MALEMRKAGGSYRQIAEKMRQIDGVSDKYSEAQAHRDINEELDRLNAENQQTARQVQRVQLEQLNDLWARYYPNALRGDIASLQAAMGIFDRIGRLVGLDKLDPIKVEHSGPGGGPIKTEGRSIASHSLDGTTAREVVNILQLAGALGDVATETDSQ